MITGSRAMKEWEPQQVICYEAGDESGGLIWKRVGRADKLQVTYLLPKQECFSIF